MKNLILALIIGFSTIFTVYAQETNEQNQNLKLTGKGNFDRLFDRKDALILVERYDIATLKNDGINISVKVGWIDGETSKFYAVDIAGVTVDFEKLDVLKDNLEKSISKIEKLPDTSSGSIYFSTSDGFSVNFYTYKTDDGSPKRNIYIIAKGNFISQGESADVLKKISNSMTKAREKLVSLGAK